MLKYIRDKLKTKSEEIQEEIKEDSDDIVDFAREQGYIGKIINEIDDTTSKSNLATKIIKLISAEFYLDTNLIKLELDL